MKTKTVSVFGEDFPYHDIRKEENSRIASSRWELLDAVDRFMRTSSKFQNPPSPMIRVEAVPSEPMKQANGHSSGEHSQPIRFAFTRR